MTDDLGKAVIVQARKIDEDCERAAIRDAVMSASWHSRNLRIGLSAAFIGVVSTALTGLDLGIEWGIEMGKWGSAATSLLAATLAAALTFLKPAEIAGEFRQYSNKYHGLRDRVRLFVATAPLSGLGGADMLVQYEKILQEKREIDAEHPIVPEWAFEVAQRKILEKEKRKKELEAARAGSAPGTGNAVVPG